MCTADTMTRSPLWSPDVFLTLCQMRGWMMKIKGMGGGGEAKARLVIKDLGIGSPK